MSNLMKGIYVTVWLAASQLVGEISVIIGQVVQQTTSLGEGFDWSQLGFLFAGSTSYMLYEIIKPSGPVKRSVGNRLILVIIGMVAGLGISEIIPYIPVVKYIAELPKFILSLGSSFFGYTAINWIFSGEGKKWFKKQIASAFDLEEKKEP